MHIIVIDYHRQPYVCVEPRTTKSRQAKNTT